MRSDLYQSTYILLPMAQLCEWAINTGSGDLEREGHFTKVCVGVQDCRDFFGNYCDLIKRGISIFTIDNYGYQAPFTTLS